MIEPVAFTHAEANLIPELALSLDTIES